MVVRTPTQLPDITQGVIDPNSAESAWSSTASSYSTPSPREKLEYSIFVGDFGPEVTEPDLVKLFTSRFASCTSAKIMKGNTTGQSLGYGFVRFANESEQKRAVEEMQGVKCGKHCIRIGTSTPEQSLSQSVVPI